MFDRFTERARKVMSLSRQEAQRFSHDYIGTEHILLGLAQEGSGVAAQVLRNFGFEPRAIRTEVERVVPDGTSLFTFGQLPFTGLAKQVLECSLEEAQNLGHSYIGTEHLLLGLTRVEEGLAAQVLQRLGVGPQRVRDEVVALLGVDPAEQPTPPRVAAPQPPTPEVDAQRALRAADRESARRRHGFVGTEHLLVGVVVGDDDAARALHEFGATEPAVRAAVDALRADGDAPERSEVPPYSVAATRVLGRAWEEAEDLVHDRVDSRHLALALLQVREGLAARVLRTLVASPDSLIERLRALPPSA